MTPPGLDTNVVEALPGQSLIVLAGSVYDGTDQSRDHVAITIRDGVIESISEANGPIAEDLHVIDASDGWVLPGLVNAHTHLAADIDRTAMSPAARDRDEANELISVALKLEKDLASGITTVRAAGGLPSDLALAAREGIQDGVVSGPRVIVSGRVGPGRDILKQARRAIGEGADSIIAGGCGVQRRPFTERELRLLADEAHRRGSRIGIHPISVHEAASALAAGFDGLEGIPPGDSRGLIEALHRHRAFLIPIINRDSGERARRVEIIAAAMDSDIRLAFGSCVLGGEIDEFPREAVRDLLAAGAKGLSVISSMTSEGARTMGLEDEFGAVAVGQRADLLILSEDPVKRPEIITDYRNIRMVVVARETHAN